MIFHADSVYVCFSGCGEPGVRAVPTFKITICTITCLAKNLGGYSILYMCFCVYVYDFLLVHNDLAVSEIPADQDAHMSTFTQHL